MNLLKLAIPTASFKLPLRQALQSASRLQVEGVQFDIRDEVRATDFGETACRQLRHHVDELRLKIASVTLPTRRPLCDKEHLDLRIQAVRNGLEFARRLGANVLTVRIGPLPEDVASAEARMMLEIISDLVAHGNRVGTTLALSTVGNSAERLRQLCREVSTGAVGLDFDPAGCIFGGRKPHDELRSLHGLVSHVVARDGMRTDLGHGVETAVGAGEVAWEELLATLAEMDYDGWLTPQRTAGENQLDDILRAIKFVRNVMQSS
ncbi:MAG: sugar phosphate isomerase/epimerase [Planctomycetaceae bacterium]